MIPCCCDPVLGSGSSTSTITIENVGGGVESYIVGTMGPYELRTFIAGDGISIIQNATTIVISSTEAETTLTSAGGTQTLVNDGVGPSLAVKGLTAAAGIQITSSLTEIFIENSSPASSVTLTSAGGTETLVNDGTGPAIANKGLTASTGISLSSDATSVTITNSSPASSVTLTSAGGTETLVNDGTGPAVATKGLTASTGITLSSNATSVTITNSSPASSVTLTSAGGTQTLVNDGTGPALATKGLTAGAGISLVSDAVSVTISTSSAFLGYFSEKSDIVTTNGTAYVTVSTMDAQTTATVGETWVFVCTALVCHPVGLSTVNTRLQWQYESAAGVWNNFETDLNHCWPTSIAGGERSTPSARTYQVVLTYAPQRIRLRMSMSAAVATGGQIEYAKVSGWRKT